MIASSAVPAFSPVGCRSSWPSRGTLNLNSSGTCGIKSDRTLSCGFQVKVYAQHPPPYKKKKNEDELKPLPLKKISKCLPYWRLVLSNIKTLSTVAEKMLTLLNGKLRQLDQVSNPPVEFGRAHKDGRSFQQNFSIRSYEIGANGMASIEALLNYLQDATLNHLKTVGLAVDGFGTTPEMIKKNLIMIVYCTRIVVDCYPTYDDMVQVSTWFSPHGKNGVCRSFLVTDCNTGKPLIRATSVFVMINKQTRKFSKYDNELKAEMEPYLMKSDPIIPIDNEKVPELDETSAGYVQGGLIPELNDLDINQHVNNSKYAGWIFESTPVSILKTHELCAITLYYRKECARDSVLQSLTAVCRDETSSTVNTEGEVKFNHVLRLESGAEIARGRTSWRFKPTNNLRNVSETLEKTP